AQPPGVPVRAAMPVSLWDACATRAWYSGAAQATARLARRERIAVRVRVPAASVPTCWPPAPAVAPAMAAWRSAARSAAGVAVDLKRTTTRAWAGVAASRATRMVRGANRMRGVQCGNVALMPDEFFIRLALDEARRALEHDDVPIGAVVVR